MQFIKWLNTPHHVNEDTENQHVSVLAISTSLSEVKAGYKSMFLTALGQEFMQFAVFILLLL